MIIRWSFEMTSFTVAGQIICGCLGSTASSFCPFLKRFFSGLSGCYNERYNDERERSLLFQYRFKTWWISKWTVFDVLFKIFFPSSRRLLKTKWRYNVSTLDIPSDSFSVSSCHLLVSLWFHKDEYPKNRPISRNHFDHRFHPIEYVFSVPLCQWLFQYTRILDYVDQLIPVYLRD